MVGISIVITVQKPRKVCNPVEKKLALSQYCSLKGFNMGIWKVFRWHKFNKCVVSTGIYSVARWHQMLKIDYINNLIILLIIISWARKSLNDTAIIALFFSFSQLWMMWTDYCFKWFYKAAFKDKFVKKKSVSSRALFGCMQQKDKNGKIKDENRT